MLRTYLTIMEKNGVFSFLGLVEGDDRREMTSDESVTAIVKLDPREEQTVVKRFPRRNDAIRSYDQAIETSVERGWDVVYRGEPIVG